MKTYGQIAYDAYCAATGGKSLATGDPLPAWDDLPDAISEAWMASGRAVDEQVRTDGIDPGDTRLGGILQRLDHLARGLDLSASSTAPSKKSEIEAGCAAAVRDIAASIDPASLGTVTLTGYQGPMAHTYTPACAGHHPISEPCPPAAPPVDIDTGNDQLVGRAGDGTVSVMLPQTVMTRQQALRHAAWLVAIADDDGEFDGILAAVRNT